MERESESDSLNEERDHEVKLDVDPIPSSSSLSGEMIPLQEFFPESSENGIDNANFDLNGNLSLNVHNKEVLRIKNVQTLQQSLRAVLDNYADSSIKVVEMIFINAIERISYDDFMQIKEIFNRPGFRFFFLDSIDEDSNNFLLWSSQGRQRIFLLQLEDEERKVSLYARRFLTTSLKNGHDALLPCFEYDKINTKVDVNVFSLGDARGFDLLSIAAEGGDVEAVRILLKLGFDVHVAVDGVTAMDLAYEKKHFGVMLELLKNHALYPDNFSTDGISDELKTFIKLSEKMHESIQDENKEKVLEILNDNPNCKFFYDTDNNSALTYAILNESFEIYEIFLLKNFIFGPKEDIDEVLNELDVKAQKKLRKIHEKHSKGLIQKHLMILLANTSVGHDNENDPEKIAAITLAYQTLDKDPRLSQILKVVAASRNFKITFDFERDSVRILNPSVEGYTNGLFTTSGKILVAAQDLMSEEYKHITYGVIAHELCHYACFTSFHNNAKPYFKADLRSEQSFNAVVVDCESKKDLEEIVGSVFESYPREMFPAETIVRYPQILAHYYDQQDMIDERSLTFAPLKDFYEEKVLPVMAETERKLEEKADIKGKYLSTKRKVTTMRNVIFVLIALLCVGAPIIFYFARGPTKVWRDLNDDEKTAIKNNFVTFHGVNVKFGDLFHESSSAFNDLNAHQIALGLKNDSRGINETFNNILHHKVFLVWENCTKPLKDKIMKAKVEFQGKNVELEKILSLNSSPLYELETFQIKNLIEGIGLKIGTNSIKPQFYIKRRFKIISSQSSENVFELSKAKSEIQDVIDETMKEKVFLLVDGPGSGKTASFQNLTYELKQAHSDVWCSYLSLNNYANVYEELNRNENESWSNVIGEKILGLRTFELSLFKELYKRGKVAFFWDGFDEVKTEFHEPLLKLFASIKSSSENFQFLSSRPEYKKTLSKALSSKVYQLIPFDSEDRENFFAEELKGISPQNRARISNKIQEFVNTQEVKHSSYVYEDDRTVNNPLLLRIIADVLKDDENVNFKNRFELYQKFVDKQFETLDKDRLLTLAKQRLTVYDIHMIYALKFVYYGQNKGFKMPLEIMQNENLLRPEEVASFGLMTLSGDGKLNFIHITFAEFFTALYMLDKCFNMTESVGQKEMDLRYDFTSYVFLVDGHVGSFIYDYLRNFHEVKNWEGENLKTFRKLGKEKSSHGPMIVSKVKESFDYLKSSTSYKSSELIRRYLMKDYETFVNKLTEGYGNIFNWLARRYQIESETKLNRNSKNILQEYKKSHQMGNIFFKIWHFMSRGEFSFAYLINRYTELNLDDKSIRAIGNFENFHEFNKFIAKNLTENETIKMFQINFDKIFLTQNIDEENYLKIWKTFKNYSSEEQVGKLLQTFNDKGEGLFDVVTWMKDETIVESMLKDIEEHLKIQGKNSFVSLSFPIKNACSNHYKVLKVYWEFARNYLPNKKAHLFCKSESHLIILQNGKVVGNPENIFQFYEKFVDEKFDSKERKKLYDIHKVYALKNIFQEEFPDMIRLDIFSNTILPNLTEIASYGLMKISIDGKLEFIHKSFAEFFAAYYLCETAVAANSTVNEDSRDQVYLTALISFHGIFNNKIIEEFVYDFMRNCYDAKAWRTQNIFTVYSAYFATSEKDPTYIKDQLVCRSQSCEIIRRLFLKQPHLVEINRMSILQDEKVFDLIKEEMGIGVDDKQSLLKVLNDSNLVFNEFEKSAQIGNIFFKIWYFFKRGEISFSYYVNNLTGLYFDQNRLIEYGMQESFLGIDKIYNLTENDERKLFLINFKEIFLNDYERDEFFWNYWQTFVKILKKEEVGNLLLSYNKNWENILHAIMKMSSLKTVEMMLKEVENYLNAKSIKLLIKSPTIYKESPTFYACNNNPEVLEFFWNFVAKFLNIEEQKFHLLCEIRGESNFYEACEFKESFEDIVTRHEASTMERKFCENLQSKTWKT